MSGENLSLEPSLTVMRKRSVTESLPDRRFQSDGRFHMVFAGAQRHETETAGCSTQRILCRPGTGMPPI